MSGAHDVRADPDMYLAEAAFSLALVPGLAYISRTGEGQQVYRMRNAASRLGSEVEYFACRYSQRPYASSSTKLLRDCEE